MENTQRLAAWQQVSVLSQQILNLAQTGEWEKLIGLEPAYIAAVEHTALFASTGQPAPAEQEMLNMMLQQIIINENEIKHLMQQRMAELKTLITQSTQQQAVNHTYGELSGSTLLLGELQNK